MDTLTRQHEAAPAEVETPPEQTPETPPATTPCGTCGAAMAPEQEWCLECGTARPDRLAARPAWRGGAAVLAVTGVLVAGAAAAAWAGLSADAKRVAASTTQAAVPPPAQTQAQPPPAAATPPPPAAAPAQPPAEAKTPPAAAKPSTTNKATPPASVAPSKPSAVVPSTPAPATKTPAKPKDTTAPQHSQPVAKLTAVRLADDAAKTYDPYNRAGAESAEPKQATDGKNDTAWTANVDPAANGRTAIGVNLDVEKLTGLRALDLTTPTPGMTVEIYGAKTRDAPVSVQDPDWTHITTQLDVAKNGRIRLGSGKAQYRHLLVWITEAAPNGDKVSLSELALFA